jgi:hypothetical protein
VSLIRLGKKLLFAFLALQRLPTRSQQVGCTVDKPALRTRPSWNRDIRTASSIEGKPLQALSVGYEDASEHRSPEEIDQQIRELEEQLGLL